MTYLCAKQMAHFTTVKAETESVHLTITGLFKDTRLTSGGIKLNGEVILNEDKVFGSGVETEENQKFLSQDRNVIMTFGYVSIYKYVTATHFRALCPCITMSWQKKTAGTLGQIAERGLM